MDKISRLVPLVGLIVLFASYSGFSKTIVTLISEDDQRGLHCEVESAFAESNVTGIALWCTKMLQPVNSSLKSEQISLTWPKHEDITDSQIQKNLLTTIQGGLGLEATTISVVAKVGENPRNYSAANAHVANFVSISAMSTIGGKVEYKHSAEKYFRAFKKK